MGYLSLLSGCCGYTFGANECLAGDDKLGALLNRKGAVYMVYLHDFFDGIDGGRCLVPRPGMVSGSTSDYRNRPVLAATEDGRKQVAFLPHGGEVRIDLTRVPGTLAARWYDATAGRYGPAFSVAGGGVRTVASGFGSSMSLLVLESPG
jgi:hypothetical protein